MIGAPFAGDSRRLGTERGAILVQVAFAMIALAGFCALGVDYGVLMVARAQAQNAADAGALAAATTLGFDDAFDDTGLAEGVGVAAAQANPVWRSAPVVTATDVSPDDVNNCPTLAGLPGAPSLGGRLMTCVRVSVYRDQERGNPLPTFFGRLIKVTEQGARAQATASVAPANTTTCLWPLAIPDRWFDNNFVPPSSFVKYNLVLGPPVAAVPADAYSPPNAVDAGSGYTLAFSRLNADVALTLSQADFSQPISPNRFVPVQVPRSDAGGFPDNLDSCNGVRVSLGDVLPFAPSGTAALAANAATSRVNLDPFATWNSTTLRINGSCATSTPPCAAFSPRLVLLPIFDVNRYEDTRWSGSIPGATPEIRIVNFVGFFIRQVTGQTILGNFSTYPGEIDMGRPMVGHTSAFLRTALLNR